MNMISENRTHQLPLFGHFCCRLAAQPDCVSQESCSGDLMLLDVDAGRQWVFMWGQLQAFRLDLWVKREHWEKGQDPVRSIVVDRVSADLWVSKLCAVLIVHIIRAVFSAQDCFLETGGKKLLQWENFLQQKCKKYVYFWINFCILIPSMYFVILQL